MSLACYKDSEKAVDTLKGSSTSKEVDCGLWEVVVDGSLGPSDPV